MPWCGPLPRQGIRLFADGSSKPVGHSPASGAIHAEPFLHLRDGAMGIPDLNRCAGLSRLPNGMFRHVPLQLRGPFRAQTGDHAGFRFSSFRKPGKND